ncbi:Inactive hydroxysteroid dehydrogenase-like protein 1 [Chionoecetes opilio]|uniref:Inactive hydroxysteroid dehydrogenase-like protein 1 n=1 Tax=Chionoecetes opilio TaxID=41210 RepID=A0A8J8WC72_CHIOP|nr:Inactive hydroxysteroid dehydrogenase-like protein 1 [Chionoecetes opilio]
MKNDRIFFRPSSSSNMAVAVDSAKWLLRDVLARLRRVEEGLSLVGLLYLGKASLTLMWDLARGLRTHVWPRLFRRNLMKEYGSWAVIAGAGDWVGRGYADVLAGKGLNVLLVTVTHDDLEEVAQDIRVKYGVEVEVMNVTMLAGELNYDDVRRRFAGKEIGILVNNITGMNSDTSLICGAARPDLWRPLGVGASYVPALTGLVLPAMVGRRRGAVVNVCSPSPTLSLSRFHVYTAAKFFLTSYSEVLRHTLRAHGIVVQTVLPAAIPHTMTHYTGVPLLHDVFKYVTPHQSVFAAHALSTLGYTHTTSGYWTFGILAWVMDCSPWWLATSIIIARLSV